MREPDGFDQTGLPDHQRKPGVTYPAHDPGHLNPPLTKLNAVAREFDQQRKEEMGEAKTRAMRAMESAFTPSGRRVQKPLRPPVR